MFEDLLKAPVAVWRGMTEGNFSFAIFLAALYQIHLMKKNLEINKELRNKQLNIKIKEKQTILQKVIDKLRGPKCLGQ